MPRSQAVQVRMTPEQLRQIEKLMKKLGIGSRAGLIKHALARLISEEQSR